MAKLVKFEEWLAPWEKDSEGKKLDEPADIDAEKLKKYLYGLLSDKEKAQEHVTDLTAERDQAKEDLTTLRREHEDDNQRREREDREREERYAAQEKRELERQKVEAIEEAFKDQGITADRAKRLAKRVLSTDEKDWVDEAKELVEDGFRISDRLVVEEVEGEESFESRPRRVVRSDGKPPAEAVERGKRRTIEQELDELIPVDRW